MAIGLSERRTEDLDLFTSRTSVEAVADALEAAMLGRAWEMGRIRDTPAFCRLAVTPPKNAEVLVGLARDSGPLGAATITALGPTWPSGSTRIRRKQADPAIPSHRWVNGRVGRQHRLRGICARVVVAATITAGDEIHKVSSLR